MGFGRTTQRDGKIVLLEEKLIDVFIADTVQGM